MGILGRPASCAGCAMALLALPALAGSAQTGARPATYIVAGSPTDGDLDRLAGILRALEGVEQVEPGRAAGTPTVRVRGTGGTILLEAARRAGFTLRPISVRTFVAARVRTREDLSRLKGVLSSTEGVEQVDVAPAAGGAVLRVRAIPGSEVLLRAASSGGFVLDAVASFVATGSDAQADLSALKTRLGRTPGVVRVDLRPLVGGASLLVHGPVQEEMLAAAAGEAGYRLTPVGDPVAGGRRFQVQGTGRADDIPRLQAAIRDVPGAKGIQVTQEADGTVLEVRDRALDRDRLLSAARAAGFDLRPLEAAATPTLEEEAERNTPAASNERVLETQARPGQTAPDFTLITKDGRGTITLSTLAGKRPVVLIFASYT